MLIQKQLFVMFERGLLPLSLAAVITSALLLVAITTINCRGFGNKLS